MESRLQRLAALLLLSGAIALAGCSSTATSTSAGGAPRPADPVEQVDRFTDKDAMARATRTGEVYLLRGLMDIFSRGMDEMGAKLNRAGVYALVTSYSNWKPIADDIVARSKRKDVSYPVIIMGHSLGGNDASKMATYLGARGVKVSYVVAFDPTEPGYVGKNVGKVVNYYLPNGDNRIHKGKGFTGSLHNVSVTDIDGITHTTVEKNPSLQNRVISRIMAMTRKKR